MTLDQAKETCRHDTARVRIFDVSRLEHVTDLKRATREPGACESRIAARPAPYTTMYHVRCLGCGLDALGAPHTPGVRFWAYKHIQRVRREAGQIP